MNWNIERIDRNHYLATSAENFFEFILDTIWKDSPEILIGKSYDMSKDNVIFSPELYPTPEDDTKCAVIGNAYRYEKQDSGMKCIDKCLVGATILRTNIPEIAKNQLEMLCS